VTANCRWRRCLAQCPLAAGRVRETLMVVDMLPKGIAHSGAVRQVVLASFGDTYDFGDEKRGLNEIHAPRMATRQGRCRD
jgi:hypothetical protein